MRHLLILLALLLAAPVAGAVESAPVRSPRAVVTLVAERDAVAPGEAFRVALRQRLAPGWHTYWTNPGDAGQPPEVAFELPEGGAAGAIAFPAPQRIPYGPLVNFGYEGEAFFPATVTPPAGLAVGSEYTVVARASWLVCERVCIPEEGEFRLTLPVAAAARVAPKAVLLARAEAALPRPSPFGVRIGFEGARGALRLEGPDLAPGAVREAFFFPAQELVLDNAAPQLLTVAEGSLTLALARGAGEVPSWLDGIVALVDGAGVRSAYTVSAPVGPVPGAAATPGLPLWQAALWAALGGLLLNLMPCVFPILAMKAVGLARLSGAARGAVQAHAVSYTAGVVLSFVALGAVLVALRAAGGAAGWGFQFTAPVFVAAMAWLMLAVGLNLSGVFEVGGPVSAGSGVAAKGGHLGAFATGGLAVLVATPCTAPFMAAAVGAALAMPAAAALLVFAAMGLGMALPYALLGVAPGLARLLPRPGAWMGVLKGMLAFPMYGAAAWLTWVAAQQAGADGVLLVLLGGVLVGLAAWAFGQAQGAGRGRRFGQVAAGLAVAGALALLPGLAAAPPPGQAAAEAGVEPWSAARVAALRAEGRPVFVNLTAAWCITCKVNERLALVPAPVRAAFEHRNVAYLKGDWTNGDAAITALLRQHGREGVPLYLYYAPGAAEPVVLPQVLTEGIVLGALGDRPA